MQSGDSTPEGLTCSPAPSGPESFLRIVSVGFTYGYPRLALRARQSKLRDGKAEVCLTALSRCAVI